MRFSTAFVLITALVLPALAAPINVGELSEVAGGLEKELGGSASKATDDSSAAVSSGGSSDCSTNQRRGRFGDLKCGVLRLSGSLSNTPKSSPQVPKKSSSSLTDDLDAWREVASNSAAGLKDLRAQVAEIWPKLTAEQQATITQDSNELGDAAEPLLQANGVPYIRDMYDTVPDNLDELARQMDALTTQQLNILKQYTDKLQEDLESFSPAS